MKYSILKELFGVYQSEHSVNPCAMFYIYLKKTTAGFNKNFYPVFDMDCVEYNQSSHKMSQSSGKTNQSSEGTKMGGVRDGWYKADGSTYKDAGGDDTRGTVDRSSSEGVPAGGNLSTKKNKARTRKLGKDKNKNIEQALSQPSDADETDLITLDDDDEEYLDALAERRKQSTQPQDELVSVVWFFIANPDNGKFAWVDSTNTVYMQKE